MLFIVPDLWGYRNRVDNDVFHLYRRGKKQHCTLGGAEKMFFIVPDLWGYRNRVSNDNFHLYRRKNQQHCTLGGAERCFSSLQTRGDVAIVSITMFFIFTDAKDGGLTSPNIQP
ncbi:hypothetical protein ACFQZT_08605 [Paenibacillus sp. GCM10027628]|uniref:hypothetical protein n=1 Tax=Paenibacillus sp. GCM10027628 TaxID=3273413 RepID=UPI0036277328